MKIKLFSLFFFVIIALKNIDDASAIACCGNPSTVYFRPGPGLNCDNFTKSNWLEWNDPPKCYTQICLDGKNHEYCSDGECNCKLFVGCEDTATECYGGYKTIQKAFVEQWAVENKGVQDYILQRGGPVFPLNKH